MVNGVTQNNLYGQLSTQSKSESIAGNSFADILSNAVDNKANDFLSAAPAKWMPESSNESAIEKATAFLDEMGIDAEKRNPTHNLTDEQKSWLKSRHDFDVIERGNSPLDDENFRADLVYLGVITPDEANGVWAIEVPINLNGIKWETPSTKGVGMLEALRSNLSVQRNILKQVEERYSDPLRRDPNDWNFIESDRKHIAFQEMYIEMMEDLLG